MSGLKTIAAVAAGAVGAWLALRVIFPATAPQSHHALETWEGEGGNLDPKTPVHDEEAA